MTTTAKTALRRFLDRIVEPPQVVGRHVVGAPNIARPGERFDPDQWVETAWAPIAERHGVREGKA